MTSPRRRVPARRRDPRRPHVVTPACRPATPNFTWIWQVGDVVTTRSVLEAVLESDLPGPVRHVVHVLATLADPETGVVTKPLSYTDIARCGGMGRSSVIRHVKAAEAAGWLAKTTPALESTWRDGEANAYRLLLPTGLGAGLVSERDQSTGLGGGLVPQRDPSTGLGAGLVSERDQSTGLGGGLVPQRDPSTGLGARPDQSRSETSSQGKHPSTSPGARPDLRERSKALREISLASHSDQLEPAERLCARLAERIAANGCLPPKITDKWITAARDLLDVDQPIRKLSPAGGLARAEALVDFAQHDDFWKARTLNMAAFRTNYDAIDLAEKSRKRDRPTSQGSYVPYRDGNTKTRTRRWGADR